MNLDSGIEALYSHLPCTVSVIDYLVIDSHRDTFYGHASNESRNLLYLHERVSKGRLWL